MDAKPVVLYLREIDPICDRFEDAYRDGSAPRIDEYLGLVREEARPTLLAHLLELQLDYQRRDRDSKRGAEAHGPPSAADLGFVPSTVDTPAPAALEHREGTRFGAFVLLRELGRGGMGVVYEALQPELDRTVALKLISPALVSNEEFLRRFRREARAAARLHHSHIVQLYEFGQQSAVPYMVLQLVAGEPLSKRIQELVRTGTEGPLEPAECRAIARVGFEIASALAYAHAQGVLHRDIKPGNILIDSSGTAYLSDFGLARIEGEDRSFSSGVLGTLRYMAPECFRGAGDAQADLYALGATLYDWAARLVPSVPRDGRASASGEQAPALRKRRVGVPRDFDTIVMRAMDPDPHRRFATAAALAADLEAFLADRPILSRRPSILERWWRWQRRNPLLGSVAAALVLCVLSLAIGSTVAAGIFRRQGAELEQRATRETALQVDLRTRWIELARQLDRAELQAAIRAHEDTGSFGELQHAVARRERNAELGPPRGWEWDFLRSAAGDAGRTFPGAESSFDQIAVQPNGKWIAVGGTRVHFFDREAERWDEARTIALKGPLLTWRADGRYLGITSWGAHFLDSSSWEIVGRFDEQDVGAVALHPTQEIAAIGMHSGELVLFAWRTREVLWRLPDMVRNLRRFSFSPDGKRLAFQDRQGDARILDLADRSSRSFSRGSARWIQALTWHPKGHLLAMAAEERLRFFDVERSELVAEVDLRKRDPIELDFDAAGESVIATTQDGTILVWDFDHLLEASADSDPPPRRILRGLEGNTYGAALDPIASRVFAATSRGVLHVWDPERPSAFRQFGQRTRPGPHYVLGLSWESDADRLWVSTRAGMQCWSAGGEPRGAAHAGASLPALRNDGRVLAFAREKRVELIDPDSGARIGEIPANCNQILWHPEDQRLVTVGDHEFGLWSTQAQPSCLRTWRFTERSGLVAFAPDGRSLWHLTSRELTCLELQDESERKEASARYHFPAELLGATALAIHPRDGRIACGSESGVIQLFDARLERFTERFVGHGSVVADLAWSPDGTRLASVSHDETLRLWDGATGASILTLHGPEILMKVLWSPDGAVLVALAEQGRILVWDASRARDPGEPRGALPASRSRPAALDEVGADEPAQRRSTSAR